jgi:O-antigen/teichoic acid export membrane protein/peptidoglycan/xylan/chitin deacetylase (PgdA/CDA1 family)
MSDGGANTPSPLRRLASASMLYAMTALGQQAVGFLLIPVYTRLIPAAEYGILELLTAFLSIAMMCVTLGLSSAINKVYHRDCQTEEARNAVVGTAVLASLPLMVIVGGAVLVFARPISAVVTGDAAHAGLLRIAVTSSLCNAVLVMMLGGLRARERAVAYSTVTIAQFSFALVLNMVLVGVVGLGVQGVLLGNLTANALALGLATVMTGPGGGIVFSRRLARPLLAFGVAILPAMLSNWVMEVSDRYLLRVFRDLSEVAQYGVGYKFGMTIEYLVTWPFQLAWPAIAFGISHESGHERTYARVLTYLLLVLIFVVLLFAAASQSVLPVVIGRDYAPACNVVPIVVVAYALNALQYCISPGIHVGGRTHALSMIGIGAAVSNLALGLLMIPSLGMIGAAWATVAAYALAFGATVWLAQRTHPVRYERGRVARILAAGLVAYVLMHVVSTYAVGLWLGVAQAGVLGVFVILVVGSGFVTRDEREYLAELVRRLPAGGGAAGRRRSGVSHVAQVAAGLGGGTLARGWRRTTRAPGRALILMYHRISDEPDYLGLTVSPAVFAQHLDVLRRRTRVVPLAALVARLTDPAPLDTDEVAITFDDGYRDNLDHALPLLSARGLPATVFASIGFVDGSSRPTGERLRDACEELWRRGTPPGAWAGAAPVDRRVRHVLAAPGSLHGVAELRNALKDLPGDGERLLEGLEALAGGGTRRGDLMLDWDGVRALAAAGIEIGSHAVTHGILSRMPPAQAEDEIRASKRRLEREVGRPVVGFAFPNGRRGDFLPEHVAALRRAGYLYACTAETGSNLAGCDAYQLRRIGVGNDSSGLLDLKLALGRAA